MTKKQFEEKYRKLHSSINQFYYRYYDIMNHLSSSSEISDEQRNEINALMRDLRKTHWLIDQKFEPIAGKIFLRNLKNL